MFESVRKLSLVVLTLSILLLTFLAILGVWEVVSGDILEKSLSTMGLLVGSSLLILFISLEREKKWIFDSTRTRHGSTGANVVKVIIFFIIFLWLGSWFLGTIFRFF
ncbi:MAG: hypothetical protein RJA61_481 [Candidatus Parcubacteria bacterium]|jgi:hypothetical protein